MFVNLLKRANILIPNILYMNDIFPFYSQTKVFPRSEYIGENSSFPFNFRVYFQCRISILRMPTKKSLQGIKLLFYFIEQFSDDL